MELSSSGHWPAAAPVTPDAARELLRHGDAEVLGRMPWSSNGTFLVRLTSGAGELLAVYKPRRGERPLWDFAAGTLHRREVAAHEVARAAGWDFVPDTVLRDGPAGEGAMQRFVDHDPEHHYFALLEDGRHHDDLSTFAAFDVVVNNADRKAGHVIADTGGRLWGIDHGVCFHEQWKLRTVIWDFGGDPLGDGVRAGLERICGALSGPLAARLRELLAPHEVDALRERTDRLLVAGCLPTVPGGHHSYPWPLV